MGPGGDRADAGSAAAVGDAERLVQVQVADVAAEPAGPGHADQRVEVGAVDVDLAAVLVHDVADLDDPGLEHAVGRRVGDHEGGQPVAVLVGLGPEVAEVDVAPVVAGHDHDPHAGHDRGGGVGAVRRGGDQAHVALVVAAAAVVRPDGQQPGQLALRPGVGLERDGVVAGDPGERVLQVSDQLPIALGLVERGERVDVRELGPGHRLHLGGGVELHRARAERDHRPVEGDVLVGQAPAGSGASRSPTGGRGRPGG